MFKLNRMKNWNHKFDKKTWLKKYRKLDLSNIEPWLRIHDAKKYKKNLKYNIEKTVYNNKEIIKK